LPICVKRNKKPVYCRSLQNLAVGGSASQSSTFIRANVTYPAGLAIDQNTDGNFFNGSVSSTKDRRNSWWKVDLPRDDAIIKKVIIWNRVDCCKGRLSNSLLELIASDGNIITKVISNADKEKLEWEFDGDGINVKSAKVSLLRKNRLHLAEVELFGYYDLEGEISLNEESSK